MRRKLLALAMLIGAAISASAQITDGRTNNIMLFESYHPATITLTSGKTNRQGAANVFLKNSSLVYMQGKTVMEAKMDQIMGVTFGDRRFIKIGTRLAEVIDTDNGTLLTVVRIINIDGLNIEIQNKSTITSISTGDQQLGVTRVEADPDQLQYPIDELYYFVTGDKHILAHERETRRAIPRPNRAAYDKLVSARSFRWSSPDCLKQILPLFAE